MSESVVWEMTHPIEAVMALAEHLDIHHINQLPGCWELAVDDTWWIALNGHRAPVTNSHGVEVPPFHLYVEYNGWPAGIVSAHGDGEFAAGIGANPETFGAAIAARIGQSVMA